MWIIGGCIFWFIFCLWGMFCNYKTEKQRRIMLTLIRDESERRSLLRQEWKILYNLINKTSYFLHLFDLIFFRNPWKRYPIELKRLLY